MNGAQKQHMKLEDLQANAAVRGILSDGLVTVVSVQWFGSEALELTYKTPTGANRNCDRGSGLGRGDPDQFYVRVCVRCLEDMLHKDEKPVTVH